MPENNDVIRLKCDNEVLAVASDRDLPPKGEDMA